MKYRIIVILLMLFMCFAVRDENGIGLTAITMLTTGYSFADDKIQAYLIILQLGIAGMFISLLDIRISAAYKLNYYVAARGGRKAFAGLVIKMAVKESLWILLCKQIVYVILYVISHEKSFFYLYDMISTLFTLFMIAASMIILKILGLKNTHGIFITISATAIFQCLSYKYAVFSLLVIASSNWHEIFYQMMIGKICLILLLLFGMANLNYEKAMIGEGER